MKRICILLLIPTFSFANTVFINSTPINATVYKVNKNGKKEKAGNTPMIIHDLESTAIFIIEKKGFSTSTNRYNPSANKIDNLDIVLSPLSFSISFPENATLLIDNKTYTSLQDSTYALPYGSYGINYNPKKAQLELSFKNPYTVYTATFGTITAISAILAVTGAILGNNNYKNFQNATTPDDAIYFIGQTANWDAVMWSSISIGTAGLIGTSIFGALEAKERKRIKRFNGMNQLENERFNCFNDFQKIIQTASGNPNKVIPLVSDFIKKYSSMGARNIPDAYLKRGQLYLNINDDKKAIADFKTIIEKYPSLYAYEISSKILGDIYYKQKKYDLSFEYYEQAAKISKIYPMSELRWKSIQSLYQIKNNNKYENLWNNTIQESLKDPNIPSEMKKKLQNL